MVAQKIRSGLLELRTNGGLLYVSPSFSERLYLLWTFRNFHRLPLQVLNQHQKQLVEELGRTAVVVKQGPLPQSLLIGSVENMVVAPVSKMESAETTDKLVRMSAPSFQLSKAVGFQLSARLIRFPAKIRSAERISLVATVPARTETSRANPFLHLRRYVRNSTWSAIAIAMACSAVLLLFQLREERFVRSKSMRKEVAIEAPNYPPRLARKIVSVPEKVQASVLAKTVSSIQPEVPFNKHIELESPGTVMPDPAVVSAEETGPVRPYMSEWPESGFRYPTVPSATLTGTVILTAVVGTDGTVSDVVVISGDKQLARPASHSRPRLHPNCSCRYFRCRVRSLPGP